MSRKVLVSFFIFFFLNCIVYAVNTKPPDILEVDFGSAKAMETVHQAQNFSLPVNSAQPNGVSIETSGLVNYQNNERIPAERISLLIKCQIVIMTASPQIVDLDGKPVNKQLEIKFDLDLEPMDHPGVYQGIIQFRFWEMKQNQIKWMDPIQVSLKVQVESWISLETDANVIGLEPEKMRINKNLTNADPLLLKLPQTPIGSSA